MTGVTQERLDRLWGHLKLLEEKTNRPLRMLPRSAPFNCPIFNFAPIKDGYVLHGTSVGGRVAYREWSSLEEYQIFERADSEWWVDLSNRQRKRVTKWVESKIAERDKK